MIAFFIKKGTIFYTRFGNVNMFPMPVKLHTLMHRKPTEIHNIHHY